MKKSALLLIGILLSVSSMAQMFKVTSEELINGEDTVSYKESEYILTNTRLDVNIKARGKAVIKFINDHDKTFVLHKFKVVRSYFREGANKEQFTFVLQNDHLGTIVLDDDAIGKPQKLSMNYNEATKRFEKIVHLSY